MAAVDRRVELHAETASRPAPEPTSPAGTEPPAAAVAARVPAERRDDRRREDVLAGAG